MIGRSLLGLYSLLIAWSLESEVLIIFTDGKQSQNPNSPTKINPKDNAQVLKDRNVTVFAVGTGSPDPIELLQMSSGPDFTVPLDLRDPRKAVVSITEQFCKVEVTVGLELCLSREVRHR
ncbi:collagen alpha-4(VI) chain-like [Stylophora pistillata]|uniref:collagen alpha-4(VI) chain-like n=1 Tax=Stylophora pistillata TaxID=50429 RepID=UPI000C0548C8|nr:collagen alpha-4(VI) chain-like [Stylophora pistillata]